MREIKFRAWTGAKMFNVDVLAISKVMWDSGGTGVSLAYQPSIKVMQYTGLKDKNGVEIYEGDLIDFGGGPFKVIFEKGCFYSWTPYDSEFLHLINHLSEVIGNIYENPELLNKK